MVLGQNQGMALSHPLCSFLPISFHTHSILVLSDLHFCLCCAHAIFVFQGSQTGQDAVGGGGHVNHYHLSLAPKGKAAAKPQAQAAPKPATKKQHKQELRMV